MVFLVGIPFLNELVCGFLKRMIEVRRRILARLLGYRMGAFAGCYHEKQRRVGAAGLQRVLFSKGG